MLKNRTLDTNRNRLVDRTGHVAALILLMVVNLFAPAALHADDTPCYGSSDFNCDRVVDGTDLAFLLSNWDAPMKSFDLDGDCRVGGGDLAIMLGGWGGIPAVPDLEPVELNSELVSFCLGNDVLSAIITSDLQVQDDLQVLEGTAQVTLAPDVQVSMGLANGSLMAIFGDTKVIIDGNTAASQILVNGSARPPHEVLETLYTDIQNGGLDPVAWAETSQITLAVLMLTETEAWTRAQVSQQARPVSHGFWCKTAAYAAATAIAALGGAGCSVLTSVCAVGSVITLGGLAVPCTGLIALCAGGTFAGCAAAYEFTLSLWGD
jgi:hypothetical protein